MGWCGEMRKEDRFLFKGQRINRGTPLLLEVNPLMGMLLNVAALLG
jgi:hypothetical protein